MYFLNNKYQLNRGKVGNNSKQQRSCFVNNFVRIIVNTILCLGLLLSELIRVNLDIHTFKNFYEFCVLELDLFGKH